MAYSPAEAELYDAAFRIAYDVRKANLLHGRPQESRMVSQGIYEWMLPWLYKAKQNGLSEETIYEIRSSADLAVLRKLAHEGGIPFREYTALVKINPETHEIDYLLGTGDIPRATLDLFPTTVPVMEWAAVPQLEAIIFFYFERVANVDLEIVVGVYHKIIMDFISENHIDPRVFIEGI